MHKIAVFDIDGTVYRDTMSFIVARPVIEQFGTKEEKAQLAQATQTYRERGSTESYWPFNKTMLQIFEAVLPRITPLELRGVINSVLMKRSKYRYVYTTNLIHKFKAEGRTLIAISGSIKDIVEPFALGNRFDLVVASGLEVINGAFTGKRAEQTNKGKHEILQTLVEKQGLTLKDSFGIGDTHRDISMLEMVSYPVAFNPNAALYAEAQQRGWDIVLERKNMIYELSEQASSYIVRKAAPIFDDYNREHLQ